MFIKDIIKTADQGSYAARADRNIQTGRVLIIDTTSREAILDVGMVNALGNPVYMVGVPYSPQAIPHSQDTVALLRTNSSPYSHVIGGGAAVGGANSGQIITSAGVNSIKKTGEASGQQGDLILDPGTGITITRTNKTFSIAETLSGILGGLLGTGVSLTLNGESYNYQYNTGLGADANVTLPNLVLASGNDTALEYKFTNFSNKNVTVTANTTTFANTIETVASYTLGPGHYATFLGIQGTGSDGVWRITNYNARLLQGLSHAGTTYTLAITDLGTAVDFTNAGAVTVTVPPHSSVAFPVDALLEITQLGAGQVTVAAGAGVTLDAGGGLATPFQYATIRLRQQATDVWVVTNFSSATGSGTAPDSAHYVTTQAESGLSAEFSLGSLTSGMLKHTVSGSVSTPATATEGTDYYKPGGTDVAVADGGTGASTAGGARTNLGLGTSATHGRGCLLTLCQGFTPAGTGADIAEIVVPYDPDDGTTSITWNVRRITLRVNVAGGAPVAVVEKSTASTAFSAATVGTLTMGSGDYEVANTTSLGTVASGNKLRFNVSTLATATGWTIDILLGA